MALHGVLDVSTHVDDVVGRGLVLAVIAVIVLVAARAFGLDLAAVFNRIRNRLGSLG